MPPSISLAGKIIAAEEKAKRGQGREILHLLLSTRTAVVEPSVAQWGFAVLILGRERRIKEPGNGMFAS